jgi:hypothetical protein
MRFPLTVDHGTTAVATIVTDTIEGVFSARKY